MCLTTVCGAQNYDEYPALFASKRLGFKGIKVSERLIVLQWKFDSHSAIQYAQVTSTLLKSLTLGGIGVVASLASDMVRKSAQQLPVFV